MRYVILAAGLGMRLGENLPKPMTRLVSGRSILEQQISVVRAALAPGDEINVVVGFKKELVMEAVPDVGFVYSPRYSLENTARSLARALRPLDCDVLWMNGDVVFHPSVLATMLAERRTSMLVNVGPTGDEEVKYRLDDQGRIAEVSKAVTDGRGEALGVNLWRREDLPLLREHLDLCSPTDYFERGIQGAIAAGLAVWPVPVAADVCVEVDFADDLARANKLVASWGEQP